MSKCTKVTKEPVCFVNTAGVATTLFAHTIYGPDTSGKVVPIKTVHTDAADVAIDTSSGTVTPGACQIPQPDLEETTMCDVQADDSVVEFMRVTVTTFTATGAIASRAVTNFELDGVTVYPVTGTPEICNDDCAGQAPEGVVTAW